MTPGVDDYIPRSRLLISFDPYDTREVTTGGQHIVSSVGR